MRNEAHRFSITHHRNKRSKNALNSSIEEIEGIGAKTEEVLYKTFKTIEGIKAAGISDLTEAVGASKAQLIINHFTAS